MIDRQINAAIRAERDRSQRIETARQRVAPILGMDAALQATSAAQLYRDALQTLGFDARGVSPSGLEAMMDMAGKVHQTSRLSPRSSLAHDAASDSPLFGASPNRKA
ncbi:hypothetical protein JK192_13770 [Gluconobacter cerinus]|uniref:Uncharacterized protein n=1 Tax=Gluconobacter oxydans TaxID=442 RepID=A0AB35AMF2_GLUOY|nr:MULTISPECIES: hypothetical protein [Gluconobacter]KXV31232.1 hypothetical protein AD939_07910 [Gluconobacter oxydans]MBF0856007.1 hypothetical protein [Gluconobacter oxydans]MBS1032445.1 hypothetical protein [Gluconobacter cerinus]TCW27527.1 hypothetical protein EDC20_10658 [Gluconobacter oxydans]GEC60511.1 hypothetical protein GOX01_08420 [Gluconobacter oxydans]